MKWYEKYLPVYGKPYSEVQPEVMDGIRSRMQRLQSDAPLVSVVMIAYNEEKHLTASLWALSDSVCKYPMEIIGVNNDSTDRTEEIFKASGIPYYNEYRHSPGYARQCGLDHAKGKYYVCIDSDMIYPARYVQIMVDALEKRDVIAVSSLWSYISDKDHSWLGLKIYEFARDTHLWIQSFKRPEMSVRGSVFAHDTACGRKIGYRGELLRGEDGSLALGLKKYGKLGFIHNRKARPVAGYRSFNGDGSFFNSFRLRFVKYVKDLGTYFTKRDRYEDDESNLTT